MPSFHVLACILCLVFALLAVLHLYRAAGGQLALQGAVPSVGDRPLFEPGSLFAVVIAAVLVFAAMISAQRAELLFFGLPAWLPPLGTWLLANSRCEPSASSVTWASSNACRARSSRDGIPSSTALSARPYRRSLPGLHSWHRRRERPPQYYQMRHGVLDSEAYAGYERSISNQFLAFKGFRAWWEINRPVFSSEFADHVDAMLAEVPEADSATLLREWQDATRSGTAAA